VVGALPDSIRPSTALDTGLDTIPYAFDQLRQGDNALQPISDVAISSLGYIWVRKDGALRYENRQARLIKNSLITFDNSMIELMIPSSMENVFNHMIGTYHPRKIDAAATTVIYSQTGTPPSMAPAEVQIFFVDYFNPNNTEESIGAIDQVAPVVTTDYLANTLADGSGTNKSAAMTVVAEYFSNTVKYTITNTDAGIIFRTKLQARGRGVYDQAPETIEKSSVQSYGERDFKFDFLYQARYNTVSDLVQYLLSQYENLTNQVESFQFWTSEIGVANAQLLDIGERITIKEEQTGLNLVDVFIQKIRWVAYPGTSWYSCEVFVSPASYFSSVWIMDDAVKSIAYSTAYFSP